MLKIVECPRDAMQGIKTFIPTELKTQYINQLLKVGYDTIDFGSFVSPKAIPQLKDTEQVLDGLDLSNTKSKLLAIVANVRGAEEACKHKQIDYLGFPFSISETFQQRNTNSSIQTSFERVQEIQALCVKHNKKLVLYISMGFGNPYNDPYSVEIVEEWTEKMAQQGIGIISLSDTIGSADKENINYLFSHLIPTFKQIEFGAHLHTAPHNWLEKVETAYNSGCKRFDAAIAGYGGCPMAKDDLVGNMATEQLVNYFSAEQLGSQFNVDEFQESFRLAQRVFPQ